MDFTLLNDATRAVHLLGLALGFGVAINADLCAARSLFRPLQDHEFDDLHRYHRTVAFGLALFWLSGLVLMWLRTGFVLAEFSPKLIAKLCVVTLLTLNAYLIGRIGLPTLLAFQGCSFSALPLIHRLRLGALAGMSGAGWIAALALGVFTAMKTFEWSVLSEIIGAIYIIGFSGAIITAVFAPLVAYIVNRAKPYGLAR